MVLEVHVGTVYNLQVRRGTVYNLEVVAGGAVKAAKASISSTIKVLRHT